jgi:hypothetical protein
MATHNWKLRPYVIPDTLFDSPQQYSKKRFSSQYQQKEGNNDVMMKAYKRTCKVWSRYPGSLPIPGYEPMAFVYQSSLPTAIQYLVLIGLFSKAAFFCARHSPINLFPKIIPTTFFTNRNWMLFAHKGT